MAGLLLAMAATVVLADAPGDERMAVVAVVAGEVLLAGWLLRGTRVSTTAVPQSAETVQVGG
jgi:hypothetical protein